MLAATLLAVLLPAWTSANAASLLDTANDSPTANPVPAPPSISQGDLRYFSQSGHFLRGAFLSYWQTHGATDVLGLPISEPFVEDGLTVQYLERARLEWHPEVSDPANRVLLTRLGAIMTQSRGLSFSSLSQGADTPTSHFFTETGHNLSNAFLTYWLSHGGLAVFGYPISEEITETNAADGRQYTVQYFERNRFEWHPEAGQGNNVQLGLLGVEYARMVNLNPIARILEPAPVPNADQDLSGSPQLASLVDSDLLPAVQALGKTDQFRWVPALIVGEQIPVEFADINEAGLAGAFVSTRSRTRPYAIVIPTSEQGEPVGALASIIAHEATHAYDFTSGVLNPRAGCSVEEELRAYMNGLASWMVLNGNDALTNYYPAGSLSSNVNESLRNFNNDQPELSFDFDLKSARKFLTTLYGSDCGA